MAYVLALLYRGRDICSMIVFVGGTFVVTNGREVYAVLFAFGGFLSRHFRDVYGDSGPGIFLDTVCVLPWACVIPDVGTIVGIFCRVKYRRGHFFVGTVEG